MDDLQSGSVLYLGPHENVPFPKHDAAEKARLDGLRLDCLKLAHAGDDGTSLLPEAKTPTAHYIDAAREMFDFVTDAPKQPEPVKLFVVRRTMEITGCEPDKTHLSVAGDLVYWTIERAAYRFSSECDAEQVISKHSVSLFGAGAIPRFSVDQLPEGTRRF